MIDADTAQTVADFGKTPEGVVRRWAMELGLASNAEKTWREGAKKIVAKYRGDGTSDPDKQLTKADAYNLLYANVQTLGPICYNSTPEPVVERRFKDPDPIGKAAGEVLRRALKYSISCEDFDEVMNLAVQDYLLPGRACVAVRYMPTTTGDDPDADDDMQAGEASESGESDDPSAPDAADIKQGPEGADQGDLRAKTGEVLYEEIQFRLVRWADFRRGPGHVWRDVPWMAVRLELSRDAAVKLFGDKIGGALPLKQLEDSTSSKSAVDKENIFQRAEVWQIWDKESRQVLYICPEYAAEPCKTIDDPYNLTNFFNVPRPLYAVETSDSLVPVAEFTLYQSLADEAEVLTNRMSKIARAIRVRGAYAANLPEIEQILAASETKMIPVANADQWAEMGGLDRAVWMWPVDKLVEVYQSLAQQREMVKGSIYEVLGVADIMRGATDPNETLGAQALKVKWGSLRTRRRQAEVQRLARDLMVMAAELIAEKFSAQTLAMMTGLWFPSAVEKQMVQMTITQAQQSGQQVPPDVQQQAQTMLALPTWEDIVSFLRNDALRNFRIDIQTDSTIALQDAEDQTDYSKMIQAISGLLGQLMPAVEKQILPFDAAKAMLLGLTRKFRLGYEVEDQLSQMQQPKPQTPGPDPTKVAEATIKAQGSKAEADARADADIKVAQATNAMEIQKEGQVQAIQAKFNALEEMVSGFVALMKQHVANVGAIEAARVKAGLDLTSDVMTHEMTMGEQTPQAPLPPAGLGVPQGAMQ